MNKADQSFILSSDCSRFSYAVSLLTDISVSDLFTLLKIVLPRVIRFDPGQKFESVEEIDIIESELCCFDQIMPPHRAVTLIKRLQDYCLENGLFLDAILMDNLTCGNDVNGNPIAVDNNWGNKCKFRWLRRRQKPVPSLTYADTNRS